MVKPPPSDQIEKLKSEKDIESIVNKGAPVKEDIKQEEQKTKPKKEKWKLVPVRIPETFLERMDQENKKRIGLSRNAWILEAIQEKLDRE